MIIPDLRKKKRKPGRVPLRRREGKMLLDINAAEPGVSLSAPTVLARAGKGKVWVA